MKCMICIREGLKPCIYAVYRRFAIKKSRLRYEKITVIL